MRDDGWLVRGAWNGLVRLYKLRIYEDFKLGFFVLLLVFDSLGKVELGVYDRLAYTVPKTRQMSEQHWRVLPRQARSTLATVLMVPALVLLPTLQQYPSDTP